MVFFVGAGHLFVIRGQLFVTGACLLLSFVSLKTIVVEFREFLFFACRCDNTVLSNIESSRELVTYSAIDRCVTFGGPAETIATYLDRESSQ